MSQDKPVLQDLRRLMERADQSTDDTQADALAYFAFTTQAIKWVRAMFAAAPHNDHEPPQSPRLEADRSALGQIERQVSGPVSSARYKEMLRLENEVIALQHEADRLRGWLKETLEIAEVAMRTDYGFNYHASIKPTERIAQIRKDAGL